ncbi:MAG: hypothetical protein K0R38_7584 [Polyangiaceae bacterium]|nr:hypothetical protein [Polyangiaceae bacterium]
MAALPMREQNARRFMAIAATLGVLGVAFNLNSEDATWPKVLACIGVATLVWSIHRFGRLGADETIVFDEPEDAPAPRKKKKKKKTPAADAPAATASSDDSSDAT